MVEGLSREELQDKTGAPLLFADNSESMMPIENAA